MLQSPGTTDVPFRYPLVLGTGQRLFDEPEDKLPLRLVGSRPFGAAVVKLTYAPASGDGQVTRR